MKKNIRKYNREGYGTCPVCEDKTILVEHHIHGRDIPGWNKKWNIAWICARCHDLVHQDHIRMDGWVMTTIGRKLLYEGLK